MTICLKAKINGLAIASKQVSLKINKIKSCQVSYSRDAKIWWEIRDKRELAIEIRHYLLALAFFNNKPYNTIEYKCEIKPSVDKILKIIMDIGYVRRVSKNTGGLCISSRNEIGCREEIIAWLNGECYDYQAWLKEHMRTWTGRK